MGDLANNIFNKVFQYCPASVLVFNVRGEIILANEKGIQGLGYSKKDLHHLKWKQLFYGYDGENCAPKFPSSNNHNKTGEQLIENNFQIKRKDGKLVHARVRFTFVKINQEKLAIAFIPWTADEFQSQENNNLLSKIFHESLNDIYIISADNYHFVNANSGALRKIGYSLDEIKHLFPWDLKPDHDRSKFFQIIEPLLSGKNKKVIFETIFERKDSSTFPVEIHLQLFEHVDRKLFMETVIDLTEKKRAEREHMISLIQAQESEKERISSELHDELGQSLTAIQLNLNTLEQCYNKKSKVDPQEIFDKLNLILQNTIVELKSISRDLMPSVLMEYGLVKALQYLCESFNSTHLQVDLQVYNMEHKLETTQRVALYRIAQELINNACKHGKANEINVQLIKNDRKVILAVEDDGIGFDFNKSFYGGGCGLKNIQSRIMALDGVISFDSREGGGTSVLVEIPSNKPI